jgi:hypothetical protein
MMPEIMLPTGVFSMYLTDNLCRCKFNLLRKSQTTFSPMKENRYSRMNPKENFKIKAANRATARILIREESFLTRTSSIRSLIAQGKANPKRLVRMVAKKAKRASFL